MLFSDNRIYTGIMCLVKIITYGKILAIYLEDSI